MKSRGRGSDWQTDTQCLQINGRALNGWPQFDSDYKLQILSYNKQPKYMLVNTKVAVTSHEPIAFIRLRILQSL